MTNLTYIMRSLLNIHSQQALYFPTLSPSVVNMDTDVQARSYQPQTMAWQS